MLTTLCSPWRGTFQLSLWLILILTCPTAGRAQDAMARAKQAMQAIEVAAGRAFTSTWSPVTGLVTFLATQAESPLSVAVAGRTTPEDVSQAFLAVYGAAFGIYDRADMQVTSVQATDAVGMQHVRLQQLHRGIPVTAGELTVHLRGSAVIAVHAKTVADLTALDVIPTLSPKEAQAQVHAFLTKRFGISNARLNEPQLVVVKPGHLEDRQTSSYLAWFVEAMAPAFSGHAGARDLCVAAL
jgi:bacillolysin